MINLIRDCWRPLAIIIIVSLCALWVRSEIIDYGNQRYDAGYAKAIAEQEEADKREEQRRDAEKQKIQADAQQRIDVARRDAVDAAARADGVRRETDRIRQLAEQYTGTQSAGVSTRKVISMLAELYEASERDYLAASTEADRYYNAGLSCQLQYNSLRNKKAP
ncbi:DUF2514 domain-containing protein [Escherichia coli]|uniref:DUF2514 family protein n=1 Tax=Escherichia coli TaxID=562 RepID=UPI001F5A8572|nr:DUF2514 family protein [Escherichia coli]MCI2233992.1 DUF2514 domain-containing protein [Escherichia coli]